MKVVTHAQNLDAVIESKCNLRAQRDFFMQKTKLFVQFAFDEQAIIRCIVFLQLKSVSFMIKLKKSLDIFLRD